MLDANDLAEGLPDGTSAMRAPAQSSTVVEASGTSSIHLVVQSMTVKMVFMTAYCKQWTYKVHMDMAKWRGYGDVLRQHVHMPHYL